MDTESESQSSWQAIGRLAIRYAKWAWLALVFVGVTAYLSRNYDTFTAELRAIPLSGLLTSFALLLAGRFMLAEVPRRATTLVGWTPPYLRMLYMYIFTQLARYLPGGIWHLVGLGGFYRANGLSVAKAGKAIILEQAWLILSALAIGTVLWGGHSENWNLLIIIGPIVALVAVLRFINRAYANSNDWPFIARLVVLLSCAWILIGLSFWAILPGDPPPILATGGFCLSWVIGAVVVFAPGGIGVRETVLTVFLVTAMDPEVTLVYAAVHRLMFVASEFALFLAATWLNPGEPKV